MLLAAKANPSKNVEGGIIGQYTPRIRVNLTNNEKRPIFNKRYLGCALLAR